MTGDYRTVSLEEMTAEFSTERKARIASRAAELLVQQLALVDQPKRRSPARRRGAGDAGGEPTKVSRRKPGADVKLSTLRGYISALGGELHLVVTFPDQAPIALDGLGMGSVRATKRAGAKTTT